MGVSEKRAQRGNITGSCYHHPVTTREVGHLRRKSIFNHLEIHQAPESKQSGKRKGLKSSAAISTFFRGSPFESGLSDHNAIIVVSGLSALPFVTRKRTHISAAIVLRDRSVLSFQPVVEGIVTANVVSGYQGHDH